MDAYRSVQTFDLCALRFGMIARRATHFPEGACANLLRGRLGKALHKDPASYSRLFAPESEAGPSGLKDAPRPFVLRVRHLDGIRLAPGERFEIGLNLFATGPETIAALREALCAAAEADCDRIGGAEPLRLNLCPPAEAVSRVRVQFLTPTELKPAGPPEFSVLFARIRDRISTLRELYGAGPLEIDFREMGERAAAIRMTRCELQQVGAERVSRSTGQRHSLGGFIGLAEYEGELAEFVPYLEIARWTGVGRQTVWGKGEIACETF